MKHKKFIVWGYPLHSHTHSYVHSAIVKAAKSIGLDTYWFDDGNYPSKDGFDYEDCLFFTEGYADDHIPILDSSTYMVHVCRNPKKYLEKEARLIDIRYNVKEIFDVNYHYVRGDNVEKINDCLYYEKLQNDSGLTNRQFEGKHINYEAIYLTWATDLLPSEILDEYVEIPRQNRVIWLGTLSESNLKEVRPFAQACADNGVQFLHNDPWSSPMSFTDAMHATQVSYLSPDIRGSGDHDLHTGTNHLKTGYVACRQFKNISYGQLGMTNSSEAHRVLEELTIFNEDTAALFYDGRLKIEDKKLILQQMKLVREKHTWISRLKDLIRCVDER